MSTDEIHDLIQNCDPCGQGGSMHILPILEHMNNKIAELETRLEKADAAARQINKIVIALAKIHPD